MKQVLYVQIFGNEFPIEASPGEELYLNRLAQFVEERMKEARDQTHIVDSYKLAVMAALNIADECFRMQDEQSQTAQLSKTRATAIEEDLDRALSL